MVPYSGADDELVEEGCVTRLRVMTFNIANAIDTEDDGENACASRGRPATGSMWRVPSLT